MSRHAPTQRHQLCVYVCVYVCTVSAAACPHTTQDPPPALTGLANQLACGLAALLKGRNGHSNGQAALACHLGSHPANAGNVGVAVGDGEAKALGQVGAHNIAIKDLVHTSKQQHVNTHAAVFW